MQVGELSEPGSLGCSPFPLFHPCSSSTSKLCSVYGMDECLDGSKG